MLSPEEIAAKWSRNLGAAGESIKAGVNAVTVSPTQLAAARQDAYVAGVQRAADTDKWRRGLLRVGTQEWQQAMISKGLPRIASGAQGAKPKMTAFLAQWLPHMEALKSKLASMPRGTIEANIARMVATVEHNASFKRST